MVKSKVKVCIVGKGSIGIRHGKIFNDLGCDVFFFREYLKRTKIAAKYSHENLYNLKKLRKKKFDLYIISNPTNKHFSTLKKILKRGINVLIEKPAVSKLTDLKKLEKVCRTFKINLFVGYQHRFDPRIENLKKTIKKKMNNIRYCNFYYKTYLPNWHKWEKYNSSYAAQKKLGGGVLLTCSHEIDLAYYLFGRAKRVFCIETKSNLATDVENSVMLIIQHKNKIVSNLNLDFSYKKKEERFFVINTRENQKKIEFSHLKKISPLKMNKIYKKQNKHILARICNVKPFRSSVNFETEKIIFAAKKSIISKKFEMVV